MIYWTDFHDFFHQMKGICVIFISIRTSSYDSFRDVAMATDFGQNLPNDLYSTRNHFFTSCENLVKFGLVTPEVLD